MATTLGPVFLQTCWMLQGPQRREHTVVDGDSMLSRISTEEFFDHLQKSKESRSFHWNSGKLV